jgi:hypothetical protein
MRAERPQAVQAGFLVAPHPALALSVLQDHASLRYVRSPFLPSTRATLAVRASASAAVAVAYRTQHRPEPAKRHVPRTNRLVLTRQGLHRQCLLADLRQLPMQVSIGPQNVGQHDRISGIRLPARLDVPFAITSHRARVDRIALNPAAASATTNKFLSVSIATGVASGLPPCSAMVFCSSRFRPVILCQDYRSLHFRVLH